MPGGKVLYNSRKHLHNSHIYKSDTHLCIRRMERLLSDFLRIFTYPDTNHESRF